MQLTLAESLVVSCQPRVVPCAASACRACDWHFLSDDRRVVSGLVDLERVTHYGEVDVLQFEERVISRWTLAPDGSSLFVDIGSGGGSLVLAAGLSRGVRAVGLEIVGHRHAMALAALGRAQKHLSHSLSHISFVHADATRCAWPPATHVFLDNVLFDAELSSALFERLAAMPSVVVVSRTCPCFAPLLTA
jgi:precorrin-6B methylase 2